MSTDRFLSLATKRGRQWFHWFFFFNCTVCVCDCEWPILITASWPLASAQTSDKPSCWFQRGWGNHPSNTTGNLNADDADDQSYHTHTHTHTHTTAIEQHICPGYNTDPHISMKITPLNETAHLDSELWLSGY